MDADLENELRALYQESDTALVTLLADDARRMAALYILVRRALEGSYAVIAAGSEPVRRFFANYGFTGLEEHAGAGINRLRTDTCANPPALRKGDVLADGDEVLSDPREGGNGMVLLHLTGGFEGHWVGVPARIPIALKEMRTQSETIAAMNGEWATLLSDIHDYYASERADRSRGRVTTILTLLGNLRFDRDEARRECEAHKRIKETEKLILLDEVAKNKRLADERDNYQRLYLELYREKHPSDDDDDRSGQYASGHP